MRGESFLITGVLLGCAVGCTPSYYRVTELKTGKVYYTTQVILSGETPLLSGGVEQTPGRVHIKGRTNWRYREPKQRGSAKDFAGRI
jgi:hypothetical protein